MFTTFNLHECNNTNDGSKKVAHKYKEKRYCRSCQGVDKYINNNIAIVSWQTTEFTDF